MDRHNFHQGKRWRSNPIRSTAKSGVVTLWIFAVLWNGISSPVVFFLPQELQKGNYLALIALAFPLAGIYLLVRAINGTREYLRFGVTELTLDPFPGAMDGDVGGRIQINDRRLAGVPCDVTLACMYSYESGSGNDRSRSERVQWSESGVVKPIYSGNGVVVEFSFQPEGNLPESQEERGNYYFWRLSVSAELPGVDLKRQFIVPVFRTGEKSKSIRQSLSDAAKQQRAQQAEANIRAIANGNLDALPLGKHLKVTRDGLDTSYYYGAGQDLLFSVFCLVFAVGFGAAVYGIGSFSSAADHILIKGLGYIFLLPFFLVSALAAIGALYLPFRSLRMTFSPREIAIVRRWLSVPITRRVIAYDDVLSVDFDRAGSFSSGNDKRTEFFKIFLLSRQGPSVTVGESVSGRELAQQMVDHIAGLVKERQRDANARRAFQENQGRLRDGNIDDLVKSLLQQGKKLNAIKLVRSKTGRGLKEAREYVERLA